MQVGLRHFSAATIDWLIDSAKREGWTRSALARGLCEREDWRDPLGRPCLGSARKLLPRLAGRLDIELPAPRTRFAAPARPGPEPPPDIALRASLPELGDISLDIADDARGKRRYAAMMAAWHPEGWARPPGGHLRYLATSSRLGVVGAVGFADASWRQAARDASIGWSPEARVANLGLVLNNHRFLVPPRLRVPGLASHLLGRAVRRVPGDWEKRYGRRPALVYTYVGSRWRGACYGAAGWERCERPTSGRPPSGRAGEPRAVWTRPLAADWKERLQSVPRRPIGTLPEPWLKPDADWADVEYGRGGHPDGRVRQRILAMGRAWEERPGDPVPVIFPNPADRRAAYRLLSNPRVGMEHILEGHVEATVSRCRLERVVLAVQDTTCVNYDALAATSGLDDLGGGGRGTKGLLAHVGLAVSGSGRPLGLYSLEADFRRRPDKDSERWRRGMERAGELASACPEARVVSVCDREGDFWDLTTTAEGVPADLLVRASRSARRRVELAPGERVCLWEHVKTLPVLGTRRVRIGARGGRCARKGRVAGIELRAARLDIAPPVRVGGRPRRMLVVSARERGRGGGRPLHWLLMSTFGEADAATARRMVEWYERRWVIEEYFRALKSGTGLKGRRLDEADDLRKCLAFDAVTAWRVFDLERRARTTPDEPAREAVAEEEIIVLALQLRRHRMRPARGPPTVRGFVVDLARLAGFAPSKRQPMPGVGKIWQGHALLKPAVQLYIHLKERDMLK